MTVAARKDKAHDGRKGGQDGKDIENEFAEHLRYLRKLSQQLGVPDIVDENFTPVLGRWSDLHTEAEQWRAAAASTEEVTEQLHKPLGKLDGSWDGDAADSFINYMQKVGLAGQDMSDAMGTMGKVLDETADGIREIVKQLGGVLADAAETSSQAMVLPVQGDERTRQYLELMRQPARELHESVRQVLEAFGNLCGEADGKDSAAFEQVEMAHKFPEQGWNVDQGKPVEDKPEQKQDDKPVQDDKGAKEKSSAGGGSGGGGGGGGGAAALGGGGGSVDSAASAGSSQAPTPGTVTGIGDNTSGAAKPEVPAAASAGGGGGQAAGRGGAGMPMMPMMPMGGAGQGGGGNEHKSQNRLVGDPEDIFGKPDKTSAPIIGPDS